MTQTFASFLFNNSNTSDNNVRQYFVTSDGNSNLTLDGDFTIEFWLKVPTYDDSISPSVLGTNVPWGGEKIDINILPYHTSTNGISIVASNGFYYFTDSVVTDNLWHNVSITRQGSTISIYVDGIYASPNNRSQGLLTPPSTWDFSSLAIGTNPSDGNPSINYNGYICNVRILNTCLYSQNYTVSQQQNTDNINTMFMLTVINGAVADGSHYGITLISSNNPPIISNELPFSILPISNICFPAGTLITTDQGKIPIEHIQSNIHTINNFKVTCITKTVTIDDHLICFDKNSLSENYPSEKTLISKNHLIYFGNDFNKAEDYLNGKSIYKVKYTGEPLYNVLLENDYVMNVNNMVCETLSPDNHIVELYRDLENLNDIEKETLIKEYNRQVIEMLRA